MSIILLDNVDVDTVGQPFENDGSSKLVIVRAVNFDTSLVEIQIREKGAEQFFPSEDGWHTLENGSFVTNGEERIDFLPVGVEIRAVLTGAQASTSTVRVILA